MKFKKWHIALILTAAVVIGAGIGAFAATTYGSQSDPLVTLSYINETLRKDMTNQFDTQLDQAVGELENRFEKSMASSAGAYVTVSLSGGQSVIGGEGCEILCRSDKAVSVGTLVDLTDGRTVKAGSALVKNHLYMASDGQSGIKVSESVNMLVRGVYSVA